MWRIPSAPSAKLDGIRITSTCVENTFLLCLNMTPAKDHLHIRGEYSMHNMHLLLNLGSPPHTWRILAGPDGLSDNGRITSTYVENTHKSNDCFGTGWDHLHIRGEYTNQSMNSRSASGSPPHTWRIHFPCYGIDRFSGITSTYVENTDCLARYNTQHQDHLHIRGEYSKQIPL